MRNFHFPGREDLVPSQTFEVGSASILVIPIFLGQEQQHVEKEAALDSIDLDRGRRPGSLAHTRRAAAGLADLDR
jgi:hypothetical protein